MREGEKRNVSRVLSLHNSTSFFIPNTCSQCLVSCLVCTGVGWKCLDFDTNGNRLLDKDGNQKTLRHKFAVYCDDIAAGADTLEELYVINYY